MVFLQRLFISFIILLSVCPSLEVWAGDKFVAGNITITGNKVTRESIILRELAFQTGDTLNKSQFDELILNSRSNLLKLPLFHFVTIDSLSSGNPGIIDFRIDVTERWYIWVWPVFELSDRNFNTWLENGDLTRLSYGLFFQQENFRGRLEKLNFKIKLGYQQEVTLLYEKPYLNRQKTIGAGTLISLSRQRETGYITEKDKLEYIRADNFMLHTTDLSVFVRWRPDIHLSHTLQLRYNKLSISDSLMKLNPNFTQDQKQHPDFFELSYLLRSDFRDQRSYPLKGWYAEVLMAKTGLSTADDYNYYSAKLILRGYHEFSKDWHLAGSFTGRLVSDVALPYYLSQALGYKRDYVRGYEYYVVDGRNFWLAKLNLKYTLIKPAIKKLKWPPTDKFNTIPYALYFSAFADAGEVWPEVKSVSNSLSGKFLKGIGVGLDFVTYYDKVFRAEFSANGRGETGFFLHFMAAI
jgi:outer membrane protein assembly factor BamA